MGELKIEERALIVQNGDVVTVTTAGTTTTYRVNKSEFTIEPAQPAPGPPLEPAPLTDGT